MATDTPAGPQHPNKDDDSNRDRASSDVPFARPDITEAEVTAAVTAIRSGWLTTGPITRNFENDFVDYLDDPTIEAVAVNSATAALHLALEAIGITAGDEVLVPSWTFTATAEVVRYLGADPVFVDSDPETLNIDLEAAQSLITPRTKAIMPVHFAGLPIAPAALQEFGQCHGLMIVEDAAHALPASRDGVKVGTSSSDAIAFSFYATKTVTTGEGGMLVTRDPTLAQRARTMRLHGIDRDVFDRYTAKSAPWRYDVLAPGYKYNLTDVAAAIGRVQLARAESMRQRRASIADYYMRELADSPLTMPKGPESGDVHSWHLFVVRVNSDSPLSRDELIARLHRSGVSTSVHFIPLHLQSYWRERYDLRDESFPIATREFDRVLSLPIFSTMSDQEIERVCETVRSALS